MSSTTDADREIQEVEWSTLQIKGCLYLLKGKKGFYFNLILIMTDNSNKNKWNRINLSSTDKVIKKYRAVNICCESP